MITIVATNIKQRDSRASNTTKWKIDLYRLKPGGKFEFIETIKTVYSSHEANIIDHLVQKNHKRLFKLNCAEYRDRARKIYNIQIL